MNSDSGSNDHHNRVTPQRMQHLDAGQHRIDLELWITFSRSILAITLGILMLVYRGGSDHILGNFIGGFWIGVGMISIRWGLADNRSHTLTLATGAAAILAGALTYGRGILIHWIPDYVVMALLGLVAVLIGILHLSGLLTVSRVQDRNTVESRVLLGVFEIGLGAVIIVQGRGRFLYDVMAAWALVGGAILLGDALYMARRDKRARAEASNIASHDA